MQNHSARKLVSSSQLLASFSLSLQTGIVVLCWRFLLTSQIRRAITNSCVFVLWLSTAAKIVFSHTGSHRLVVTRQYNTPAVQYLIVEIGAVTQRTLTPPLY